MADAHTTEDLDFGDGRLIPPGQVIEELNVCMQWVSYPGVTNRSVPVDELTLA